MTIRVLGLDVGKSGAAAVLERGDGDLFATKGIRLVDVIDLPFYEMGDSTFLNGPSLQRWLLAHHPDHAFIERVNAMPAIAGRNGERRGMGTASAFSFGDTFGSCRTAVHCAGLPVRLVVPRVWKKEFALKGGEGAKEAARCFCVQRLPQVAHMIERKKDEGRAEAILIALYGIITLTREAERGTKTKAA